MRKKAKVRIGIIGCGAIGSLVARACLRERAFTGSARLIGMTEELPERVAALNRREKSQITCYPLEELLRRSDLVVEAAAPTVVPRIIRACIRRKKDCVIVSSGGLLSRPGLIAQARRAGIRLFVPSGAIAGVDALKAAAGRKISHLSLTTRKPPAGLAGAPYLLKRGIDVRRLTRETVVFRGTALSATKAFPQNINVAATLSLATGIDPRRITVTIVTGPGYTRNVHEVSARGAFGELRAEVANVPSPENPKTSFLAALSVLKTVASALEGVRIGS